MSQFSQLTETWRGLAEASLRYYGVMGRLALDSFEAVLPPGKVRARRLRSVGASAAKAPAGSQQQPAMVLEAEAGRHALGVFVVENAMPQRASGNVVASPFTDPSGRAVEVGLRFSPEVVTLEPREQVLVQLIATPGAQMEPSVRYRGEVSVPGFSGMKVPVVLIRRPAGTEG